MALEFSQKQHSCYTAETLTESLLPHTTQQEQEQEWTALLFSNKCDYHHNKQASTLNINIMQLFFPRSYVFVLISFVIYPKKTIFAAGKEELESGTVQKK